MSDENQIRERVTQYLTDHHRWAMSCYSGAQTDPFRGVNLESARSAFIAALSPHCVSKTMEDWSRGFSLSWPPTHDPALDQISDIESIAPNLASVLTTRPSSGSHRKFFDFNLRKLNGVWLIAEITPHFCDPKSVVENQPALSQLAASRFEKIPADDYSDGIETLFSGEPRIRVRTSDVVQTAVRSQLGRLAIPSGYLVCSDPGIWDTASFIFDLPVPPGNYPVEIVQDERTGSVTAARVVFDPSTHVVQKICATRWEKPSGPTANDEHRVNSHYIGTDTATIGLIDAKTFLPLTRRQRRRLANHLDAHPSRPDATDTPPQDPSGNIDATFLNTGRSDGAYPAFWLLGEKGEPLQLIVDFKVLANPVFSDVAVPFQLNRHQFDAQSPELNALGIQVRFSKRDGTPTLQIKARPAVQTFHAYDAYGRLLFSRDDVDSDIDDNDDEFYLLPEGLRANASGDLKIQFYIGSRYEVVP